MNATTIPFTCWCGTPATMTVPIDPEVTSWDGELRQSDGTPAIPSCDEHARDGYESLAAVPEFQLTSWTEAQLQAVRATAIATEEDNSEALVIAIDAELEERIARGQLDREEAQLGRKQAEAVLQDRVTDVLAELILNAPNLSKARLEALGEGLPSTVWRELAAKIDVCPIHCCDEAICLDDDDDECREELGR